jgi:hypothetical protein
LNCKCSLKAHVLKALCPAWVVLGGTETFGRWGLIKGSLFGHWGCALEEDIGTMIPCSPLPFLSVNILPLSCGLYHDVPCCHKPKAMELSDHGLKPLKLWAIIKLFPYWVVLHRYFVTVTLCLLIHTPIQFYHRTLRNPY